MPVKKITSKHVEKLRTSKFKANDTVTFDSDGDTLEGTIIEVEGKMATVEVDDEQYACELTELTLVEDNIPMKHKKDEEEEEEPAPKKKKKVDEDEDEEDEEEAPKKKKGKGQSLAALYKKAKPAEDFVGFPVGNHDALITDAQLEFGDKGTSAYFEYTGVGDEDIEGKTTRGYYNLLDADGELGGGFEFFKRDMGKLGYEDFAPDSDDEIQETLDSISKAQTWVAITVRKRKDDPSYTNVFLNGMHDDQNDKPELPD